MNERRFLMMLLLMLLLPILVYSKKTNKNDEGIPDDPNHPLTVAAMREYKRADQELNEVYKMLMEVYSAVEDPNGNGESVEKLKAAQLAWIKYRDLAATSETSLYAGGHPAQEAWNNSKAEMSRERIARLIKMIENIYKEKVQNSPNEKLTLKIKKMLEQIKIMDAEGIARHKEDLGGYVE